MKEKYYILLTFIFHLWLQTIQSIVTCPTNFVALPYGTEQYCAKCDTTCLTCSNEGMNNCIQCPTDFTYDQKTSYCLPPNTKQIKTIESSYKFTGFSQVVGWSGGIVHANLPQPTLYSNAGSMSKTVSFTPAHYKIRILISLWFTDTSATAGDWIKIDFTTDGTTSYTTPFVIDQLSVADYTGISYKIYPVGWRTINVDRNFYNSYQDSAIIKFTSSKYGFGIRQFILIQYLCNQTACSRCDQATNTSCLQCTQSSKRIITSDFPKKCLCDSSKFYFEHPDWDYCVKPCPNRINGQYYGDSLTKKCSLTCSGTNYFADPVTATCQLTCTVSITLGNIIRPLYYDIRNQKCVTICPQTEPFFDSDDRKCYSICRIGRYQNNRTMQCVVNCPSSQLIPLFGENNKCVQQCVGVDNWGDFNTHKCTNSCSLDASGRKYFQDNSTGRNLCVRVCPFPTLYGDDITNPSQPYCDQVCPSTPTAYYGDYLDPRHCVTQCRQDTTNSINYYGLKLGSRQCVKVCPQNSWGQKTTFTCVLTMAECYLDNQKYADNITWTCVARGACSKGRYTEFTTKSCVINCPDGSYADDATNHCEAGCTVPYFADPGINKCVQVCQTQDLYADVDSSRTCVPQCNQAGQTPFRNFITKTCVNKCPTDRFLFADTTAKSCVYNCTPGTYSYNNMPLVATNDNKTCVFQCPANYFGDNSTGYGQCILRCPSDPPLFGDVIGSDRVCVPVCQSGLYGDQDPANGRLCVGTCPDGWFAQNDNLRRCVKRCNSTTYGYLKVCIAPTSCPSGWVGDPSTNLCVDLCPIQQGTFSDFDDSKLCVKKCPIINNLKYFADPTNRFCVRTCNSTALLFGNNATLTCQQQCIDKNSFADSIHINRLCVQTCTDNGAIKYYRNNYTKTCVISTDCPDNYFADNQTLYCVAKCPIILSDTVQTWGHISTQTCVRQCYGSLWGDTSTGIPLCVQICPTVPAKWSYDGDMTCVTQCPYPLFGQDFTRTCTPNCPNASATIPYQTFAANYTRRCFAICPQQTFGDYLTGQCYQDPEWCTYGWGDDYNNSCVHLCTGPSPWDSFGDSVTWLCQILCTQDYYADNYTGTRQCVPTCPGTYDSFGNVTSTYDTYGDNDTNRCVTHCMNPLYYADWQTHRCQLRCTGDITANTDPNNLPVATYANIVNKRCVIAVACPKLPDKLYGENRTRTCKTSCYFDNTVTQWADNLTRSCIPQCYRINDASVYPYNTIFYGDLSTGVPICIIKCPVSPRLFGQNITNKCVPLCPDNRYGDQVNNRSCVADCYQWDNVIYYSQITERLCVDYCEDNTYANWHNRHCQTVPSDCPPGQFANDGNNSCVALCPQYMNFFGDPSTKKCVAKCPNITVLVQNVTANIYQPIGHLYADYKTRLCVRTCPQDYGLQGTFGDNFTTTCVQRCPDGSFGDDQTVNRHCVATCTNQNFGDPLTRLCVDKCPASPPYFGYKGDWTCVKSCPTGLWADAQSRLCVDTCPVGSYRLTSFRRQCVNICPSNPDLYADDNSDNCQSICTLNQFADPTDRTCKSSCLPLFQYNYRCVKLCPSGYYANLAGNCVTKQNCDLTAPFAQNRTTKCVPTCTGGSFGDTNSHYCIAICPDGWYGDINICVQNCITPGTSKSIITQTCVSTCPNLTYHQNNTCKPTCQHLFANDQLGICHTDCPLSPIRLFTNPNTHDCVQTCDSTWYRDLDTGDCVQQINGCSNNKFSDFITGNCVQKCSQGYWGDKQTHKCIQICVDGEYGYESTTERTCYIPLQLPADAPELYADPESRQFIPICHTTPKLYFADTNRKLCVQTCLSYLTTQYYGDPQNRKCVSTCTNITFYTADHQQDKCVLKCTLGTFRYDNNNDPICKDICPSGYADDSTRKCVDICPVNTDTFGFYNMTSSQRICIQTCPDNYYADPDPLLRTCRLNCDYPLFADNTTHKCVDYCINSFADLSNQRCMDKCYSNLYPSADNSTNKCVLTCPSIPDYYNQNHICKLYCTTIGYFADPSTRQCVNRCPNVTTITPNYFSYGDQMTGRCVKKCPEGYWADNTTNKCKKTCQPNTFADNLTRVCVAQCPKNQQLYADPLTKKCSYTCSGGYFASQVTQTCIPTCDNGATQSQKYWGDPLTTLCVNTCPQSIYSYGENITRKCVISCIPYTTNGFADNYTRICRDQCQNNTNPKTFADPTTSSCVEICPQNYFAENTTVECKMKCLTGYADNYSRYCVLKCPDDPQTFGQIIISSAAKICVYQCFGNRFSNNDTNLCVDKCPTVPDFFGDRHVKKCVYFCTQGTYAQNTTRQCLQNCPDNSFADNLTRKCVAICPTQTQTTYRDYDNWKCVRVCPDNRWADNLTKSCVPDCPLYTNGTQTYQDNISKYCVLQCPYPYFGKNTTHQCVLECSALKDIYGHPQGRFCVDMLDCYPVQDRIYYADPQTDTCVQTCPQNRWADDLTFVCVLDCDLVNTVNKIQYRNLNNQKCVSLCPSDPDQYADDISGNCVPKCPDGSYAYATTNFRKCVSECGTYNLFADDITNRCVNICPTQPFLYADINTHKCVSYCNINSNKWFSDNKTQTCVQTCPISWQLWGQKTTFTCVKLCPDLHFGDILNNRECVQQCTLPLFADKYTSKCIQHCYQIKQNYYQDISTNTGICVEQCPGDSYGYNIDQQCKYKNVDLSSSCPGNYYADRQSKKCVKLCPNGTYADDQTKYCQLTCFSGQYADNQTRKCVPECSANYFALQVNPTTWLCVQFCPSPYFAQNSTASYSSSCVPECTSLYEYQPTRSCESYCPQPYFADLTNKICELDCQPQFAYIDTRQCKILCPSPTYANPLTFTCDLLCPDGYYGRTNGRICDLTCQQGTFADPSTRLCVNQCPEYPLLFADDDIDQCVQKCQNGFGYQPNRTCLSSCPNMTINTKNIIYLADSFNHRCVLHCINQLLSFADYTNNQCTSRCPDGTFASNFTKQCVPQCPTIPQDTFAQNTSNICMDICPANTYGSSQNLYCVTDCWWPNYQDDTTQLCVQTCPDTYFAQNETAECVKKCSINTYADPTTKRCVKDCPLMHDLFKYDQDCTCVKKCPPLYYADDTLRACKQICHQPGMYAYQLTRQCVRQCPVPYRAFDGNNTCILKCPDLYFYNVTRNKCTKCPIQCLVCTDPYSCLKCASGYNLFNGICDISCQPENGIITYSNPLGICVRICPFLWYGDNSSYACTQTCPSKQYGSNQTQLCQNCPQTCSSCLSLSVCITCQSSSTLAIDKMCYKDCNSTHKYYYNSTCTNICPSGTYVTYTQVTCGSCGSNCLTCNKSPTNCTSCSGKYYYQNQCLSQCPVKYYGSPTFICQLCTPNIKACQQPLKFTTQVKIQNYQYNLYVKFNQQVDIKKQIEDLIKIKLKIQRRLLNIADMINNGIKYKYQLMPDGMIKLTLIVEENLISPQFVVEIVDPTAISSKNNGGALQNVASQIFIQKLEYYSQSQAKQAQTNIASRFTVIFILLLYAITFFWTDTVIKPIQLIQIIFLHITFDISLPAPFYYYLLQFKSSFIQFLPNLFNINIEQLTYDRSIPQKIKDIFIDYNFLLNMGHIFTFIIILLSLWLIFYILSSKKLISNKVWHNFFNDIFQRRFKYMIINDIVSLFYIPVMWFGIQQFQNLSGNVSKYNIANPIITIFWLILVLVIPIIWGICWKKMEMERFQVLFSFMCKRIKGAQVNYQIYNTEEQKCNLQNNVLKIQTFSEQKLKSQLKSNKQLQLYKHKQDQKQNENLNITVRSKHQLQTIVNYIYLLSMIIFMLSLQQYQTAQLSMLIITNIIYLSYLIYYRPYLNIINTIMLCIIILTIILIQSYMLYFHLNTKLLLASEKIILSKPLIITISIIFILMIIWTIFMILSQFFNILNYFKKTQFYLLYGDPQYIVQKQQSQKYQIYQQQVQKVQENLGDIIIQNIYRQLNQKGQSVIKVKKKTLKKKKKLQGRKKKYQINNKYQQNQILNQQQQSQQQQDNQQDYIRINKPTPFQFNHIIQNKQKSQKQQNMIKVKKMYHNQIDDDIRQNEQDQIDYYNNKNNKQIKIKQHHSNINSKININSNNKQSKQPILVKIDEQQQQISEFYTENNSSVSMSIRNNNNNKQQFKQVNNNQYNNNGYSYLRNNTAKTLQQQLNDFQFISDEQEDGYKKVKQQNKKQSENELKKQNGLNNNDNQDNYYDNFESQKVSELDENKSNNIEVINRYQQHKQQLQEQLKIQQYKQQPFQQLKQSYDHSQNNSQLHISQQNYHQQTPFNLNNNNKSSTNNNNNNNNNQLIDNQSNYQPYQNIDNQSYNNFQQSQISSKNYQKDNLILKEQSDNKKNKDVQIINLQDLLEEEYKNKNHKLMFLFDEEQKEQPQN